MITREQITEAYSLIKSYIRRTPVLDIDLAQFGGEQAAISLKLESMQHAGSFKTRGAFTNLLTRSVPAVGVAAASGGNHGVAVAYAANELNIPAKIFVPTITSPAKLERIRELVADVVVSGDRYSDALAACDQWLADSGAMSIHAYDQTETLIGQGTLGLEIEEQLPNLDTLLIAVGGGGLIGGIAAWYQGAIKLVAVEPEGACQLFDALKAGEPVPSPAGSIAADSLAPRMVGQLMFPIAQKYVDKVLLVSDENIVDAQKRLWKYARIVAEPGGAAAFSALTSGKYRPEKDERVGVVVCGGNTVAVNI